uniref:Uncharacterized protein n=1 Tax=Bracon brevicornis TaxID=1563983 RepID=A0A6V7KS35_9HYME
MFIIVIMRRNFHEIPIVGVRTIKLHAPPCSHTRFPPPSEIHQQGHDPQPSPTSDTPTDCNPAGGSTDPANSDHDFTISTQNRPCLSTEIPGNIPIAPIEFFKTDCV